MSGLIEMALVFALVVGFGVWQLLAAAGGAGRTKSPGAQRSARHPERQEHPDPVGAEPVEGQALVHHRERRPE